MALLVLYAQPSRLPGNPGLYDEGDVVDVLEDGQHPGKKTVVMDKFAFVKVPGTRAEWLHLKEEYHLTAIDIDGFLDNVEMLARRIRKLTVLDSPLVKAQAMNFSTAPAMTKMLADAATVDKSKPAVR